MSLSYQYTPYIWPMLATAVFAPALAIYAWRRRGVPGALPLAVMFLLGALWAICAALELAAVDVSTKIFWDQFVVAACLMPVSVARFCFVLEFAGLGKWLTHRNLALLTIPVILELLLVLTNDFHHWFTRSYEFDGTVHLQLGVGGWIMAGFGYLLFLANLIILAGLFYRSPPHRWPVALIVFSMLTTHTVFLLDAVGINPVSPLDPTVLSMNFAFVMYALALFRFHIIDPIPASRKAVIEQMREGMLVADTSGKIVDLNPTVESILGLSASHVRGRDAAEVLPDYARVSAGQAQAEISLGAGDALRYYELTLSPLKDRRNTLLGHLLLLHDVTEQKQAQAQLLEQQRAVATLKERERLARELHDSIGQVLGYVSMQVQSIHKRLRDGDYISAENQLARLAEVAKGAHADVRESIFSLKAGAGQDWSFTAILRQHLDAFRENYGIDTALSLPADFREEVFDPSVEVQLLRVIQEALTNARKHGRARCLQVSFELRDGQAKITIADDGRGFDPHRPAKGVGEHFGLAFMRERMEQIDGRLDIQSQPGMGTRVVLEVPTKARPGEDATR
ncbi:MAG: hypothetical protein A2W35_14730 [Chloroflexi bacterium RBG_16_57_11]|nr:MAG: hypothetical protein A2W35_14730 [Chloroflexi bacterium RBG_16_57_11]